MAVEGRQTLEPMKRDDESVGESPQRVITQPALRLLECGQFGDQSCQVNALPVSSFWMGDCSEVLRASLAVAQRCARMFAKRRIAAGVIAAVSFP